MELTAVFIEVPEGYIAFVEELPGANTQGATLDEARTNLREAVAMVLEANRELAERSIFYLQRMPGLLDMQIEKLTYTLAVMPESKALLASVVESVVTSPRSWIESGRAGAPRLTLRL